MKFLLQLLEWILRYFLLPDAVKIQIASRRLRTRRHLFYQRYGLAIIHTLTTLLTVKLYPPDAPLILIPITWAASLGTSLIIYKGFARLS